jgi:glucose uptake protein
VLLPSTHTAGLALLLVTLLCLSIWPILYKRAAVAGWRFELFEIDFGLGAVLFSLLAAYTLGTLGREMSFIDRMLIAGRTADAILIAAGVLFGFANMTLLAGISLLGLSIALPIEFGTGALVFSAFQIRDSHLNLALAGGAASLLCLLLASVASRAAAKPQQRFRSTKGIILTIIGGLALGAFPALVKLTLDPEFGPGPYAIVLMFSVGILVGTPIFNFFFMNIKVIGNQIGYRHYIGGGAPPHIAGFVAGMLVALGILCWLLVLNISGPEAPGSLLCLLIPGIFVLVCVAIGANSWKELSGLRTSKSLVAASIACFAAGLVLIGLSFAPLAL